MKNLKKFLAIFLLTLLTAVLLSSLMGASVAQAEDPKPKGPWEYLQEWVKTGQEGGISFAQHKPTESLSLSEKGFNTSLTKSKDLKSFILQIVNFALGFLGLLAVIIVIYGGVLYLTAGGEDEKTQTGKKAILYAVIGLLIVMGSFAFVNTIISGGSGEGEAGVGGSQIVGESFGPSFNAAAIQVQTIARDIYAEFILFGEAFEEIKSIQNDAGKASLQYSLDNIPTKANILNFLQSVKQKLLNLRSRVGKFSAAYNKISELVREYEDNIDSINSYNKTIYAKVADSSGRLIICDPEDPKNIDKESYDTDKYITAVPLGSDGKPVAKPKKYKINLCTVSEDTPENTSYEGGMEKYIDGLKDKWKVISENINSADETSKYTLSNILTPIKEDYKKSLESNLNDLEKLMGPISNMNNAEITKLYDSIKQAYINFKDRVDKMTLATADETLNLASTSLLDALEKQSALVEALQALKSVSAHLSANVVSGNAPLIVLFDASKSVDPAGGSIIDANIIWDNITGSQTFAGGKVNLGKDAATCNIDINKKDDVIGPAFRKCIFKYPGTYIATITVKSNDPTTILPGMSSLVVTVAPPTTQINLQMTVAKKLFTIMEYYDNGILHIDKDIIPVTLEEAKEGITLDAQKTENVANFSWDFGNGSSKSDDKIGLQTIKYKEEGKYTVTLEILNSLGQIDRKIFTIDVTSVAARIQVRPGNEVFINEPVTVDGTISKASSGKIKAYDWTLTRVTGGTSEDIDLGNDTNKSSFIYKFTAPGKYKIDLTVAGALQDAKAETYELTVKSKVPTAMFDYLIPKEAQPATLHFSASKSFDPDGDKNDLSYEWIIGEGGETAVEWELKNNTTLTDKNPVIKFNKKGDYAVTLKVTDTKTVDGDLEEEYGELTKTVKIDNVLDLSWGEDQKVTGQLVDAKALIDFNIKSTNAQDYKLDFGDGDIATGEIAGTKKIPHTYSQSGTFMAKVTVYDEDNNDTSIQRRIFIGDGANPVANAALRVNGVEVYDLSKVVEVNKSDILTFEGSESINIDGSGKDLKYSWNFGDTNESSNKSATHSYKELSPLDPGYLKATLLVYDREDPTKKSVDEIKIKVINQPPTFSSIQAVPASTSADLVTPVQMDLRAHGAVDEDGSITQYRWWYFDLDDPSEPLGLKITTGPTTSMTIGTTGKEGKEVTYGFGLEITDSDNISVSSEDILEDTQIPEVTVENGPNDLPTAKFSVDVTKTFTGDKVTFTSASKDPDGKIEKYIWDFDGDGFFNDKPVEESSVEHAYQTRNLKGYEVRLKVIDDKGGEAVSPPIKIYVDTMASDPVAAFKYELVAGSGGKKVKFKNNSGADTKAGAEIISNVWDFDTASLMADADSDGDGKKDNDKDSEASDPEKLYSEYGEYKVKLTITDNQGNKDEVINRLKIPLASPPTSAFTYEINEKKVSFKNTSKADTGNGAKITKYAWDFDTLIDSDGDGVKDNDNDSSDLNPSHEYAVAGTYKIKLKIEDDQGGSDDVINSISIVGKPEPLKAPQPATTPQQYNSGQTGTKALNPDPYSVSSTTPLGSAGPNYVSGGSGKPPVGASTLLAVVATDPAQAQDGVIYLTGEAGYVVFDFSGSVGSVSTYIFDKNIYFDTNKNGINDDEEDFKTKLPGTWKTQFRKAWGKTVVKFTVVDHFGNKNSTHREIKFK